MTSPIDTNLLLDAAREAVLQATIVVRAARERVVASGAFSKSDASPVTVADMAGQALVGKTLKEKLGDRFGPLALVGEESSEPLRGPQNAAALDLAMEIVRPVWSDVRAGELLAAIDAGGDKSAADRESFWTLDPIDGTKGFMRPPSGHYSCCLAYIHKGRPIVGVLGCPTLDLDPSRPFEDPNVSGLLIWSIAGQGAHVSALEQGARGELIRTTQWEPGRKKVRVALSAEPEFAAVPRIIPVLTTAGLEPEIVRLDSQCKYAMVALGRADLFMRLPKRHETPDYIWDHASGDVVVRESGGRMTDTHGLELDFGVGKSLARNAGFLAAGEPLHARLLEILKTRTW